MGAHMTEHANHLNVNVTQYEGFGVYAIRRSISIQPYKEHALCGDDI